MGFEWHKIFMILIVSVAGFMNRGRRCAMPTQFSGHWWHFWHFSFLVSIVSPGYFLFFVFVDCLRQLLMVYIIRTEHKYQDVDEMAKMVDNADMFRAQRNVYVSGLAFALALVIKRVFTLGRVRDEMDKYKKFFVEQKDS
jgi:hypothetical protein